MESTERCSTPGMSSSIAPRRAFQCFKWCHDPTGQMGLERLDSTLQQNRATVQTALESLAPACTVLGATRKKDTSASLTHNSRPTALEFPTAHADAAAFQRLAIVGAQMYITAMHLLEAGSKTDSCPHATRRHCEDGMPRFWYRFKSCCCISPRSKQQILKSHFSTTKFPYD